MGTIEIISASAGSGKTHELAEEMKRTITAGEIRPDAVMAMTFTVKAAEELRHRARTHLLKDGRRADAERLGAARMGTVNSVCAGIVGEFAFDLGLSPTLGVLDEEAARTALRRALSSIITDDLDEELDDLKSRLDVLRSPEMLGPAGWDWQSDVQRVIELARANNIGPEALAASARRSLDGCLALLGTPVDDPAPLETELRRTLDAFVRETQTNDDRTQNTEKIVTKARSALRKLRDGRPLKWDEWARFASAASGAKSRAAMDRVHAAALQYDVHPKLHQDLRLAVEIIFDLAARCLERYQADKRERGVLDFIDQEAIALELLARPDVQRRLAERTDLVLVDEFQDTSPIQLAIFLRLAEIAPRSVWVGDQKQAIYAFRGTDPALMDAVIDQVLAGEEPRTLESSWRSRPPLVHLTNDLFAGPFAERGIPEARVRLRPACTEPEGLGPVVESWKLTGRRQADDIGAVAAATRALLADETACVRDGITGGARRVRPDDVAILCRRNKTCVAVADALAGLGIEARLGRHGLLETTEARVVMAGLALWVDGGDALSRAELARIVSHPEEGDAWLAELIERPGHDAFTDDPVVSRIITARIDHPMAGAVEIVDRLIDLVGLVDVCRRWGNTPQRLANVEALRRHVAAFAAQCEDEGRACTPTGVIRHLEDLAEGVGDDRGLAYDEPAVTVTTWHRAKGLEWPITCLFEMKEMDAALAAIGVHVECDRDHIDLADPLAERWIRYWPYPLGYPRKEIPFRERLEANPLTTRAMERHDREELRLLYVGWTRARDRVALAARKGRMLDGAIERLRMTDASITEPADTETRVTWSGHEIDIAVRHGAVETSVRREPAPDRAYPPGTPREHPPAFISPSSLKANGSVAGNGRSPSGPVPGPSPEVERIGPRMTISGTPDWSHLGTAVHGFLAADRADLADDVRRRIAERLLTAWGVDDCLDVDELLAASTRFSDWVKSRWPDAKWRREVPIEHRLPTGSIIRGEADLVLETEAGVVVIDHKSFPGSIPQAIEAAASFGPQVAAYAAAVTAALSANPESTYLHMPVSGMIIKAGRP